MTSVISLVLFSVSLIWALLLLWIALDRYWYERLTRRRSALRRRLSATSPADERGLRTLTGRLSIADVDRVLLEGLPPQVELAVARAVERGRADLVRQASAAPNVWDRIAAVRVLTAARAEQRYELAESMLTSGEPLLGAAAVRLLARINDGRSADILVNALRDGVYSRSRIAAAIDKMSVPRADLLGPLFDAPDAAVRFWAAKLAARLNAPQWRTRLRRLMSDRDPLVRRATVEALGVLGDASDAPSLLEALKDPISFVRAHAARACIRFADEKIADALVALLADRDWLVRAAARDALQHIGRTAFPAVVQALWHADNFAASSAAAILHRTGAASEAAHRVLTNADDARQHKPVLARFLAVGGPYVRSAFLGRLNSRERTELLGQLEPVTDAR